MQSLFAVSFSFALFATTVTVGAQDWIQRVGTTPTPTYSTRMAYDQDRAALVLFGGLEADEGLWPPPAPFAETWEFQSGAWTQRTTNNVPPARSQHVMTYSSFLDAVIVFGGIDAQGSPLNDVWWFDGVDWHTQYYSSAPIARAGTAAYSDGGLFIVGGWSPVHGMLGDCWSWSRQFGWSSSGPPVSPRRDAALGKCWTTQTWNGQPALQWLLHGGVDDQGNVLSSSYRLSGGWIVANGSASAPALSEHTMVYDPVSKSTLLAGGRGSGGGLPTQGALWRYDGNHWSELPAITRPPATAGAAITMDTQRNRLVLVGGAIDATASQLNDQHWEFAPGPIRESFGSSCSAFNINATLYCDICARGQDWQGEISTSNNHSWALFVFGLSNTSWNGFPLPFNLALAGNPVCDLLVEPAITQWRPTQPGVFGATAEFSLPIPNLPSAYGMDIYAQALSGNGPNILVTTQGIRAMIW